MHPETLRKAGVGVKWVSDAGMLNMCEGTSVTPYDAQYKAKKQFYDQRREYNSVLTKDARAEHLTQVMQMAADRVNENLPLLRGVQAMPSHADTEAVLLLTDWHFGMTTDNVWNKYNVRICKERLQELEEQVIRRLCLHEVETLHVMVLGDMANGAIHLTSRVASEEDVCDQLMQVSEILAEMINVLSGYVDDVKIYCAYGNHMRTVQDAKDSIHSDNMEKLIPWWLEQRFKNRDEIRVMTGAKYELLRATVCGHEVCGIHGDLDHGKNSALILNRLYENTFGVKMEYLVSGHFHSISDSEELGVTWIKASSLCGTDEYAKNKRLFSEPGQTLLIFNDKDGLDAIYHLRFSRR